MTEFTHTCINVNFLVLILNYRYIKCINWRKLNEGNLGSFYAFAASYKSIVILIQKVFLKASKKYVESIDYV